MLKTESETGERRARLTCLFVFQIGFSSASSRCEVSALRAENRFERKKKQTNKLSTRLKWNKQIKVEQQTSNAPEIKDEGKRRPICAICNPLYIFLAEFKNCSSVKYESQRRNLCSLCSLGFHYGRKGERLLDDFQIITWTCLHRKCLFIDRNVSQNI